MVSTVTIRHTTNALSRLFVPPIALSAYALPTIVINKSGRNPTRGTDLEGFPARIALLGQFLLTHTRISHAEINQRAFRVGVDNVNDWQQVEADIMARLSQAFQETLVIARDLTQIAHQIPGNGVKLQG